MKRVLLRIFPLLSLVVAIASCQNKELGELGYQTTSVDVRINWEPGQPAITTNGMRINLFSLDEDVPHYGMADVPHIGSSALLRDGASYRTFAYTYQGNNIYFRNQLNPELIEAYCAPASRSTYSRSYPEEATIVEASGEFYVGENDTYTVLPLVNDQFIDVYPVNKLYTYTVEIRGIEGVEFISETRGAISGMSSSYFLAAHTLSTVPSTVLFDASKDVSGRKIIGSFRTFGRLGATNNLTIEILYPSNTNGIAQYTWDVTSQIDDGINYHIVIDNSGVIIPDEGGSDASMWKIDVEKWEDVTVPLQ